MGQLVSDARSTRLRVALFHGLPPGGALRALYEMVRRFPPEIQVDLFMADVAPADRFADLAAGTYRLDLPGSVASTRIYQLPAVVRALAPRLGRIGAFVVAGEGVRRVQKQMAYEINHGGYDVAYVHACRFSLSVPIAEWLSVPCVFYAQKRAESGSKLSHVMVHSRAVVRRPSSSCAVLTSPCAVTAIDVPSRPSTCVVQLLFQRRHAHGCLRD